jgi:hypothetical protein
MVTLPNKIFFRMYGIMPYISNYFRMDCGLCLLNIRTTIGVIRREYPDHAPFWNASDLERKPDITNARQYTVTRQDAPADDKTVFPQLATVFRLNSVTRR